MSITVPLKGFGGGGTSLNFDVKAYATEEALLAAAPKENTIGIITGNKITSWVFSATEPPAPAEGLVWIATGTSSPVKFNALKKNGIQVYPLTAKQYIGGAWVDVICKSYQSGAWVDWWNGELYTYGNEYESITGGWEFSGYGSKEDSYILIGSEDELFYGPMKATTKNMIALDGFSTIVVHFLYWYSTTSDGYLEINVLDVIGNVLATTRTPTSTGGDSDFNITLDISSVSKECFVQIVAGHPETKTRTTYAEFEYVRCYK